MVTIKVVVLALIYIALLVVMGSTLVSIMSSDVKFTDETGLTWHKGAASRAGVKAVICFLAFCAYLFMIINFKFVA
ncbi:MAG: hypothetical protein PVF51_01365 [Nitrospirota bacterium]|jgi:hypothetical protein